jgi:hypothetical protein
MCQGQAGTFTAGETLQTQNPTEPETRAPSLNTERVSISLYYRFMLNLMYTFILWSDSGSRSWVINMLQIDLFYLVVWTTGLML